MKPSLLSIITLLFAFSISLDAQTISSFYPTSGTVGTTVTIVGEGFSATANQNMVAFNGTNATVSSSTPNSITVDVPAAATSGPVTVTVSGNTATSSSIYTVLSTNLCSTITRNNAKHWYFGNNAALKFENNQPVALTNSAMAQVEGVATMSDANGNLLFYTDGITIYNRNHTVMVNGSGLLSSFTNTQAAFIMPFAGNQNKYYVLTPNPYYYSVVDMALDGGNGAVVEGQKNILLSNESSEKIAGVLATNEQDIWLITYAAALSKFNVFKIDESGVNSTPVSSNFTSASGFYGYMKISPDGSRIATANFNGTFTLYDFNRTTGEVSNQKIVDFNGGGFGSYGIEFSPNGQFVYVADHRGLHQVRQYDITLATPELIEASVHAFETNTVALGALQLGLDNKIYLARENAPYLGVIHNPNIAGSGADFVQEGFYLEGKTSNLGLPGFVTSTLVNSSPYIQSFSPTHGEVGDQVTIQGIGFSTTPENNIVKFNGIQAQVISATSTTLVVIVPEGAGTGQISLEIGCGLVATSNIFTVGQLGIQEQDLHLLSLYPNPTTGIIHFSKEIKSVELYNLAGQKLNVQLQQSKHINLSHLPNGTYILKTLDTLNYPKTFKVLKK
jgi:hypothetical protein